MFRRNRLLICSALALALGLVASAEDTVRIKRTNAHPTDASSGAEMYQNYCASCHGASGRGDGPAAPALKGKTPDLTQISRNNHGQFPMTHVTLILQGKGDITAHGSKEMPIWGDVFHSMKQDYANVKLRIYNLTQYVASLQQK